MLPQHHLEPENESRSIRGSCLPRLIRGIASIDTMEFLTGWCACLRKRKLEKGKEGGEGEDAQHSWDLFFELRTLQIATNFFSDLNLLGQGGFGPVFKGSMPSGQEVAVKKLSLNSRQGHREFINEVKLLLRIQHKNLVTLLGCCAEGPEMMLVYEYLPNKSLDYFLFDKTKSSSLDWTKRCEIIYGVARGLLYLHDEAPQRIIHRDIKASNILLDEQLNPKISDFGLARLFPGEGTHTTTFRISGTPGYMAPEYATYGYLSVKIDVFSYGVLVLEILSGRKNRDSMLGEEKADLLSYLGIALLGFIAPFSHPQIGGDGPEIATYYYLMDQWELEPDGEAWKLYQGDNALELVDPSLVKFNPDETAMCIQLGLCCCQASNADRPDMKSVHLMLSSDSFTLPIPGKPGIQGRGAITKSNAITPSAGIANGFTDGGLVEDYSRNNISVSSVDEGR